MGLKKLSLQDKKIIDKYLSFSEHSLSFYALENILIWNSFYDIGWEIIDNSLCIFFKDKIGCFLYLPPLGAKQSALAVNKSFEVMDRFNANPQVSRIENIEEQDVKFFKEMGLLCREKSLDYLCSRSELANLKGNKFKSKRASLNYFTKHYDFESFELTSNLKKECLSLYDYWSKQRKAQNEDHVFQGMLDDSRLSLKTALDNYNKLDFTGMAVKVNGKIGAFSFGYPINKNTFCILFEITDLSIKGLAQFIFAEFCSQLKGYKYINIMDDSGLENLKKVKLSYKPARLIPAFIATR
ncbi:MAG: phosphatidylglycerol lysyltransferase domain-containing protein [Candidatus Omnitrophica bacterium]|nr:phosphatidylglycerol lysyltransferase domain-containing protein [Candidatus Omnitrophota bacterium]